MAQQQYIFTQQYAYERQRLAERLNANVNATPEDVQLLLMEADGIKAMYDEMARERGLEVRPPEPEPGVVPEDDDGIDRTGPPGDPEGAGKPRRKTRGGMKCCTKSAVTTPTPTDIMRAMLTGIEPRIRAWANERGLPENANAVQGALVYLYQLYEMPLRIDGTIPPRFEDMPIDDAYAFGASDEFSPAFIEGAADSEQLEFGYESGDGAGKPRRKGKKTAPTAPTPPGLAKAIKKTHKLLAKLR
jgi:hypothetical protein